MPSTATKAKTPNLSDIAFAYGKHILSVLMMLALSPKRMAKRLGYVPHFTAGNEKGIVRSGPFRLRPFTRSDPKGFNNAFEWRNFPVYRKTRFQMIAVENGFADHRGHVFSERFQPVRGAIQPHPQRPKYVLKLRREGISTPYLANGEAYRAPAPVIVLAARNQDNYYHWLFDAMCKLRIVGALHMDDQLLYMDTRLAFQRRTLELLEIPQSRIVSPGEHPLVCSQKLFVPAYQAALPRHHYSITHLNWLRELVLKDPAADEQQPRRIYVSRARAKIRRLLNEDDVFAILKPLGFQKYHLEELSMDEQAALFHQADYVVAPHGAGLSNLLYCRRGGARVIEFFPGPTDDCFYRLASDMDLPYRYIISNETDQPFRMGRHYTIDIDDLRRTLEILG